MELGFLKLNNTQKTLLERASLQYEADIAVATEYLESRGLSLEDAKNARLGVVVNPVPGQEHFRGRLSIPYVTPSGVVDLRFRSLGNEEPKYMGLPGAKTGVYNVRGLWEALDSIAVCEGEVDAITLHYKVGIPAIGLPGATSWKRHYTRLLQDYETIYVFADGDQPGRDFAKNIAKELRGVIVLEMPEGEDVNSMYLKKGAEYFKKRMEA
jgi:DNA primase